MLFFYHCVSSRTFCVNFRSQKVSWNVSTDRGKVLLCVLNFCLYNASPVNTCYLILMFFISRISSWCLKCVAGFAVAFRRGRRSSHLGWAQAAPGAWWRRAVLTPPADVRGALIWLMPGCRQPCPSLSSAEPRLRGAQMSDLAAQQLPLSRGNGNLWVNSFFLLLCDHLEYFDP